MQLNEQHHIFSELRPLPYPHSMMQYRRKRKDESIML